MSKIKSMLAVVLAIATLLTMSTIAFAAELDQNNTSGNAIAYYKAGQLVDPGNPDNPTDDIMEGTYLVTIPEYIEAAAVGGKPTTEKVKAEKVLIPYGTTLTVAASFKPELALKDNAATKIAYDMQLEGKKIATGAAVLTVPAGDPNKVTTSNMGAVLTQAPSYSGVYTDTATFVVSVA